MTTQIEGLWTDFAYKPHQITGIQWMINREAATPAGGLLCDEMGLGKTMEVLGTIVNNPKPFTLLLCPKAVIRQWVEAATRSSLTVYTLTRVKAARRNEPTYMWERGEQFVGRPTVYITNYDKLSERNVPIFQSRTWDRFVMDEAHKAIAPSMNRMVHTIQRSCTWCVTATPIINGLKDVRSLLSHVDYDVKDLYNYKSLQDIVSQTCMLRSMGEMRRELPELPSAPNVRKELLDFDTEEEKDFYQGIQGIAVRMWHAAEQDTNMCRFALLTRLRQISVHPQVYISAQKRNFPGLYNRADWTEPSTKFNAIRSKIESAAQPAKWIVFCQFHDEMSMLRDYLSTSLGVRNVFQYHGKMIQEEKEAVLQGTKEPLTDGRSDVLLVQLQSGGVGLNLQHFTRIIFMSPWWTNAMMEQAIGRAVRIGQREQVQVTILSLRGEDCLNIDEKMLKRGFEKRGIMERLFNIPIRGGLMPIVALDYEKELERLGDDEPGPVVATQDPTNVVDE
jgi:SNF2 family DNA or RNA helicase